MTTQQNFKRVLTQELEADDLFRQELVSAGNGRFNLPTVIASGGSTVSGRDSYVNSKINNRTRNSSNNRHYGGIVVAVFAVVVIALVLFIGRAVVIGVGNFLEANTLNGSSTCADYIGSSDDRQKVQVMKDLYLKYGKTEQAANPFIIQNTEYVCGNPRNQAVTLDRLAQKIGS